MQISRRQFTFMTGLATGGLFLPHIAFSADEKQFRVAQPWKFNSLNPRDSGYVFERAGVVEHLAVTEPDGQIVPAVAESWSANADATEWRFVIRKGVKFHDGTDATPEAIRKGFEKLMPNMSNLKQAGLTAISNDEDSVVFHLERPFGPFPAYLIHYASPVLAPSSFDASGNVTKLIGTGPFRLDEVRFPREAVLAANDAYWGQKPTIRKVLLNAYDNGETRGNVAIAGDAELVAGVPPTAIDRVIAGGNMRIERTLAPWTHMVLINVAKPQFTELATRRALNLAMDRVGIATSVMRNPALTATQYFPSVLPGWHSPDLKPFKRDVAAANALLDEAGWVRGDDGIRAKSGVRFAGTLRTFANRPEFPVIAAALQSQFAEIGFKLTISVGEWTAIVEGQRDGSLDLGLSSQNIAAQIDPIGTVNLDFANDEPSGSATGATGWRNDEFRANVASYLSEASEDRKAELRHAIATTLHEELPILPVCWYEQVSGISNDVAGAVADPLEKRYLIERMTWQAG